MVTVSEKFKQKMKEYEEKLPDDIYQVFREMVGSGTSPNVAAATIEYVFEKTTQEESAWRYSTTEVSIRNNQEKARELLEKHGVFENG